MKTLLLFVCLALSLRAGTCSLVNLSGVDLQFYFAVVDGGTLPDSPPLITIPPGSTQFLHGGATFWFQSVAAADLGDVYDTFSGFALSQDEDVSIVFYDASTYVVRFKFSGGGGITINDQYDTIHQALTSTFTGISDDMIWFPFVGGLGLWVLPLTIVIAMRVIRRGADLGALT